MQNRILSNLEKLKRGGASSAQVSEYLRMEEAKSGKAAVQAAIASTGAPTSAQAAVRNVASRIGLEGGERTKNFATGVAREVAENPAKTAGGVLGGITGFALGGGQLSPMTSVPLSATFSAGGEAIGESIDNLIFSREGRTAGERLKGGAVTLGVGLAAPAAIGVGKAGFTRAFGQPTSQAAIDTAKTELISAGAKPTSQAMQRIFGKDADDLTLLAEQTALSAKPKGTSAARGAVVAEKANQLFRADTATDAVKKIEQRRNILQQQVAGGIPKTDIAKTASDIAEKANTQLATLRNAQRDTNAIFATSRPTAPANISAKEINGIFDDPKIAGALKAAGGEDIVDQLRATVNIPLQVQGQGGRVTAYTPTERDITAAIANLTQAIGGNPQVEAVFWRDVYENGLKPLLDSKSDALSRSLANQFEQRFALFRAGQPLGKKLYEGDLSFATDALATPEAFKEAMQVWKDAGIKENFQAYAKNAILQLVRDADGAINPQAVKMVLGKVDPNTLDAALGKGYYNKLKDVFTTTSAIEAAGVERGIMNAARGLQGEQNFAEQFQGAAVSGLTGPAIQGGNALGFGARLGAATQTLFRGTFGQGNSFADASMRAMAQEAISAKSAAETYPKYAALAASLNGPVLSAQEYELAVENIKQMESRAQELQANIPATPEASTPPSLDELIQEIDSGATTAPTTGGVSLDELLMEIDGTGGQGGPEEVAPSMAAQQRDFDALLRGDADVAPDDELSQLIDQATLHSMMDDDLDLLVKQQLKEDTKVASKVSTRQEEGFRTRMYRDTRGFRTVGVGFNMDAGDARKVWRDLGIKTKFDDVLAGRTAITRQEAETLYAHTKNQAKAGAARLVKNFNQIGEHRQAALADMVFQLGQAGAMGFARTRALIEAGKYAEAAAAMMASANARQTPNRVLRRAYMLQHNVSLAEADAALVKAGKISAKESINAPQDLSKLMEGVKVAAVPQPMATPARRKRPTYAQAKANKGIA